MSILRPTPAQLGAANLPDEHDVEGFAGMGGSNASPDPRATVPITSVTNVLPRGLRGWRARQFGVSPVSGQLVDASGVQPSEAVGAAGAALVEEHRTPGVVGGSSRPDARRVFGASAQAGYPLPASEELYPSAEQVANVRTEVAKTDQTPMLRGRLGFTGEDNTRASALPLWLFGRPFDKWSAESTGAEKVQHGAPLAARPIDHRDAVPGSVPSPGGGGATGQYEGVGVQPNSVRLLPRPWDEKLANVGGPGALVFADPGAAVMGSTRLRGLR